MGFGGKSGLVVGRLKTAKGDVKYGSVMKRFSKDSGNVRGVRLEEDGNEMGARVSGQWGTFSSLRARSSKHDSTREETEGCTHHFSRDYGRKGGAAQDGKRTWRGEGRGRDADVTSHYLRSKTRKPSERNENDDAVENSDRKDLRQKHNIVQVSQSSKRNSQHEELLNKHVKKTIHKKSLCEDSPTADDRPKKQKRVIRLDPNDISNKRIDDSAPPTEETVEEKEDTELSKNAQFRAIKPSPSILSFVEDNLLGRRRTIELKKAGYNIDLSAPLDNIPLSTSTERERIEESVFRNKLEFFAAAKVSSSFPPPVLPEIAFAGRSNVGKSSLLNALTRQWGVVRTSDKPGHTQTINFFRLASKLCMVDLPGYGFAYAKEEVKEAWEELVKEYVSTRDGLQRVCLLVDTKWGMKPRDHELIELMERSKTPYQIVLTKTDIVFPMDVARRAMQIQEDLKTMKSKVDPVMMVSSKSGAGIRSLRMVLSKLARFIKP